MTFHNAFRSSLLCLAGIGMFSSTLQAQDGVARVRHPRQINQYYMHVPNRQRQPPNPTYWTRMPLAFHGCCDSCGDPNCPGRKAVWTAPAVRWLLDPDYYALPPDYGWSVVGNRPIRRQAPTYQRMHPEHFAGTPGAGAPKGARRYPIIAQPTDTTQLGYYYNTVPTWQPRNILPPPPDPRTWHVRNCEMQPDGSYWQWRRINHAWAPQHMIPGQSEQRDDAGDAPAEADPVPAPQANEPEALNEPIYNSGIRKASY